MKIALPFDGSPCARRALDYAIATAARSTGGIKIDIVNVQEATVGIPESFEVVTQYYNAKIFPEAPKSADDIIAAQKGPEGQYALTYDINKFYFSVAFLHALHGVYAHVRDSRTLPPGTLARAAETRDLVDALLGVAELEAIEEEAT